MPDDVTTMPRSLDNKMEMSMPDRFDVGAAGETLNGFYGCLFIFGTGSFSASEEVIVHGEDYYPKMAKLGAMFTYGQYIYGNFTKVKVPTNLVVVAYKR